MLSYNEITPKKYIVIDGEPYEVLSSHVFRKQMRKPVNQTKLRHMISGKVTEKAFHQAETIKEAEIGARSIKYLYSNKGEFWFCDKDNPKDRFSLPEEMLSGKSGYLKKDTLIDALLFDENIIGLKIPVKMDLKVKEAPPAVKGNTAQGATKQATLETGAIINVPLFINEGDTIRVNTDTGEYTERVMKK